MLNRFVTNIHLSFAMVCALCFEPSASTVSLQKAMAAMFGGIMILDLTSEGLANRQSQIYSTKLKFQNSPPISFRQSNSILAGLSTYGGGHLDDGTGDLPVQPRNSLRVS